MEFLQSADEVLFHFINITLANPVTDKLMPFITERNHWFIFYVIIWLYLFIKGGAKGRVAALMIIPVIFVSDQFADGILKPLFHRTRPCHVLPVHLLINCSESFSFPSNHAVNNFAAATLFSFFYPKMKYVLFAGALVVALSRVFVGVHYPFDLVAGLIVGSGFAMLFIYIWKMINRKLKIL